MDWKDYKYPSEGDYADEPVVGVVLSNNGKNHTPALPALVDSGAQATSVHKSLAKDLGIELPDDTSFTIQGFDGKLVDKAYPYYCELTLDRQRVFTGYVLFVEKQEKKFPIILGQNDFFENFDVKFEKRNSVFRIGRAPMRGVDSQ